MALDSSKMIRFIPELVIFAVCLVILIPAFVIPTISGGWVWLLLGAIQAPQKMIPTIIGLGVICILPFANLGLSGWLHFKKKKYWLALFAMAPTVAAQGILVYFFA